jgi:hypothetical protein
MKANKHAPFRKRGVTNKSVSVLGVSTGRVHDLVLAMGLTVVQRIPSGPNGIQRIPAESPANDAPSLASCNWRIPTGGSPAQ